MATVDDARPSGASGMRVAAVARGLPGPVLGALVARERHGAGHAAIAAALGIEVVTVAELLLEARMAVRAGVYGAAEPLVLSDACRPVRRILCRLMDGEPVAAADVGLAEEHTAACAACRTVRRGLRTATRACRHWDGTIAHAPFVPADPGPDPVGPLPGALPALTAYARNGGVVPQPGTTPEVPGPAPSPVPAVPTPGPEVPSPDPAPPPPEVPAPARDPVVPDPGSATGPLPGAVRAGRPRRGRRRAGVLAALVVLCGTAAGAGALASGGAEPAPPSRSSAADAAARRAAAERRVAAARAAAARERRAAAARRRRAAAAAATADEATSTVAPPSITPAPVVTAAPGEDIVPPPGDTFCPPGETTCK